MRQSSVPRFPFAILPCLVVALALVSGCRQADLPSQAPGTKTSQIQTVRPPSSHAPSSQPQSPAVPSQPGVTAEPLAPIGPAAKPFKEEVRAALLVPLSGPQAALGAALSNASQLAVFEIADTHFNLIPLDTRGTPEGAIAAVRQATAQGADIILGPLFAHEVKAAAPVAREHGIPMLSFTTDRSALGNGVYSLGFLPNSQVKRVIAQARADNRSRFGVLAPNDAYGRAVAEEFKAAAAAAGLQTVRVEFYDPKATDFTGPAKRFADYERHSADLKREKQISAGRSASQQAADQPGLERRIAYDAVLLPDTGVRLKSVASLLTYYGLDPGPVKFLGTMIWDDPSLADEPSLQGGWYPAPAEAPHRQFEARYVQSFGPLPPRSSGIASNAYDATALAAALAQQNHGDYSQAALTNPNGFAGADGIFRLMADGTSERGLAVRELARGGSREVYPAPTTFEMPGQ